ncbi:hypothetical protein [Desulfobacula sp.]
MPRLAFLTSLFAIKALEMASICCSPRLRVPPAWFRLSAKIGKRL